MINSKPIFIVELPVSVEMSEAKKILENTRNEMKDYHILMYIGKSEDFEFKCFYDKDFKKADFNSLKKIIKEGMSRK